MYCTDLAYRRTAVEGASGFGLLVALYDTLVGDLRRGAAAQRAGDLEKRAKELKHALLVVGFLQNWVEADSGELANWLIAFYTQMRARIVEAQARQSADILEEQMAAVLGLRQLWQQLDLRGVTNGAEMSPPRQAQVAGFQSSQIEQRHISWSA